MSVTNGYRCIGTMGYSLFKHSTVMLGSNCDHRNRNKMLKMEGTQAENKGKNGTDFHKDRLFLYSTTKDFLKIDGMN